MGVREAFGSKPKTMAGGVAALVILASITAWWQGNGGMGAGDVSGSAFFTIDDGKSYFVDSASRVAPFERDGKQAVQAVVFSCDEGKSKFVGYLQRAEHGDPKAAETKAYGSEAARSAIEIKRPGEAKWLALRSVEGAKLLQVKCPAGQKGPPAQVTP